MFDCGNFQRIGIRHRESQTLYLSDLIDTQTCDDPRYGKLHVGIHLAIVQDALNRLPKLNNSDAREKVDEAEQKSRKRRHRSASPDPKHPKKRKVDVEDDITDDTKLDLPEVCRCLDLVNMCFES